MADSEMQVRKLTADEAANWSRVGEQAIFVSDIVDQATAPQAEMTVGFHAWAQVRRSRSRFRMTRCWC